LIFKSVLQFSLSVSRELIRIRSGGRIRLVTSIRDKVYRAIGRLCTEQDLISSWLHRGRETERKRDVEKEE